MKTITFLTFLLFLSFTGFSQETWQSMDEFPGGSRERLFNFTINDMAYVGMGRNAAGDNQADVWRYDPELDTWTQMGDFPGEARRNPFSFSIGSFGYLGMGFDGSHTLSDVWKYDPSTDEWTQLADFEGTAVNFAAGFSIGDYGYLVSGGGSEYIQDVWQFHPNTETWSQLSDFPGIPRWQTVHFVLDGKAYFGGGGNAILDTVYQDLWEFDPLTDSWTQKANLPSARTGTFSFAMNDKGYMGNGYTAYDQSIAYYFSDFWQYDPINDSWLELAQFPGEEKVLSFCFAIGDKGYVGAGRNYQSNKYFSDFWKWGEAATGLHSSFIQHQLEVFPNPTDGILNVKIESAITCHSCQADIVDLLGKKVLSSQLNSDFGEKWSLDLSELSPGVYSLVIQLNGEQLVKKVIVD